MADERTRAEERAREPRPRNEPTEVKEIPGSARGRGTTNIGGGGRSGAAATSTGVPRTRSEKVGTAVTPRSGSNAGTTTTSSPSRSNQETRGAPRTAGDEKGMPKRSGPK